MTAACQLARLAAAPQPADPVSLGHLLVLAMLWLVTAWRLPAAVRNPRQRTLWTAFAALAVSITLGLPAITDWVDTASGVHNVVMVIKHLIGLVACDGVLAFVTATTRPESAPRLRRLQLAVLFAAQAGLVVSFCLLRHTVEVADFFQDYPGSVPVAVYELTFAGYLGSAMGFASWLFGTSARRAAAGWLRTGLRVLGAGTTAGFCYAALRVCQVVLQLDDRPMFLRASLLYDIEWTAIALILLGSSIPAVGSAWTALRAWRTARRLRPLWAALTTAVPEVVLTAPLGRSPRVLLHRRVIEIRDASLVLAGYADEELRERVARQAGADRPELAEALLLRACGAQKLAGRFPGHQAAPQPTESFAELDFEAETRRLLSLAAAHRSASAIPVIDPELQDVP
ncbi:hypothetical protein ABH930_004273 [Kitasatospora sp. GAS204A]|uniref:MAB_1171c family putative transporter n=1 Tax=unclassified Kitasatospora TaxID=2633591 RepID=UPI002474FD28|nr:MAB_1171c family putative transporter [Kitasatospora sp. GAS204B]MDH6119516.1 hypothetical protein [Kitasatospora sp. GAS204B]